MALKTALIIPSRWGSTRFPGKSLALLGGKTILQRVIEHAKEAARQIPGTDVFVATDDERIEAHCQLLDVPVVMTSSDCKTGSDRVRAALESLNRTYDFVVNMQGDAPFTPPDFIEALIHTFAKHPEADVVTPVVRLSWEALEALREQKKVSPMSGTTAVMIESGRILWFSKQILPAIRGEEKLRISEQYSPVLRHVGLYGFKRSFIDRVPTLPHSRYEDLEALEQLRFLEAGAEVQGVLVDYRGRPALSGIDSPEDLVRAERLLQ